MSAPSHTRPASSLRTSELDYSLPQELIAQHPVSPRDASRLLVLHRTNGQIDHRSFTDLPEYLSANDCLVLNTTRVRHARLPGKRASGGRVEILLVRPLEEDHTWEALVRPFSRLKAGEDVELEGSLCCTIIALASEGRATVTITADGDVEEAIARHGHVPLPPYISREDAPADTERYQTIYADRLGAVAAPTAGLHFTPALLSRLQDAGVQRTDMVLHVGPGTFRPVSTERVSDHALDAEWTEISAHCQRQVKETIANGHRVVAVGTTSVRGLETMATSNAETGFSGWTDLLIAPPYEFKCVGSMITNFHLPRSSLLALVGAFAGLELILHAYDVAVQERYRFYSYGDAMLIV